MEEKIWAVKDGCLVNRDGSIYKLNWKRTGTMRKVNQSVNKYGYLYFNRNGKVIKSHRFIAECFIPNPQNLPEINHKNEIKNDNRVENLEWCTRRYNMNYGSRNKRSTESRINHPQMSKKVFQFTLNGEFVKEWASLHEIGRVLGLHIVDISKCCNGKRKSVYGFFWSFDPLTDLSESNNSPRVR